MQDCRFCKEGSEPKYTPTLEQWVHVLEEFDGGKSVIPCTRKEDDSMFQLSENDQDTAIHARAKKRGQETFTVVEQDITAVQTIAYWIMLNIEQAPEAKLRDALEKCLRMRNWKNKKVPD